MRTAKPRLRKCPAYQIAQGDLEDCIAMPWDTTLEPVPGMEYPASALAGSITSSMRPTRENSWPDTRP